MRSFVMALAWCVAGATNAQAPDLDAETLYARACAACHGPTGAGLAADSPLRSNFEVEPADLTDPLFNSREPAADWHLVIKYGGAALGLSDQMPAYGHVFSDEQIDRLVGHLKTLADTRGYPPGELNFLRPIDTIKAFPEDEVLWISDYRLRDGDNSWSNTFYWAHRIGPRGQTEVKLTHPASGSASALEEVEIGFKLAVAHDLESQSIWSVGLEAEIPLGKSGESEVLVPFLSGARSLGRSWTLQGTLRSRLPTEGVEEGDVRISAAAHWMKRSWPRGVFPAIEAGLSIPFRQSVRVTLLPQVYVGLSRGGHVSLSAGVEIPLAESEFNCRLRWFLLWDVADGPFWRGWR